MNVAGMAIYTLHMLRKQRCERLGLCVECEGRGWHVGECRPQEECGACGGTGRKPGERPSEKVPERKG